MIEKQTLESHLEGILSETGIFLVDVRVNNKNRIIVHVDKNEGLSIEDCVMVSRALEGKLDRDHEDFSLDVSSPGLDAPFKVPQQYEKSIGKMVEVSCIEEEKKTGKLKALTEEGILLEVASDKKGFGPEEVEIPFNRIDATRAHIQF